MPTATTANIANLGPLTTVFPTPAASCTQLASNGANGMVIITGTQSGKAVSSDYQYIGCGLPTVGSCQPSGVQRDQVEGRKDNSFFQSAAYFSPGVECPQAWTTALTVNDFDGNNDSMQRFLSGASDRDIMRFLNHVGWTDKDEMMAICCPKGFQLKMYDGLQCLSSVAPESKYSYTQACEPDFQNFPTTVKNGQTVIDFPAAAAKTYPLTHVPLTTAPPDLTSAVANMHVSVAPITLVRKDTDPRPAGRGPKPADKDSRVNGNSNTGGKDNGKEDAAAGFRPSLWSVLFGASIAMGLTAAVAV